MDYVFTFDSTDLPGELLTGESAPPICVDCGGTDGEVLCWTTDDGHLEWAHWPSCQPSETPHAAQLAGTAA